jgi:predicted dehydrogenase
LKKNLSRRQFLVQSAGLASASLGLGVGRTPAGELPSEVRVGIIGAGDRGRHLLGAAVRAPADGPGPRARVTAVCDPSPKSLRRGLDIASEGLPPGHEPPRGHTNWRALLDSREVDAVFIATPVHLHAAQAISALAAGKHVYLEKPLATDEVDSRAVLEAAREAEKKGLVLQVGLQRRYDPRYRASMRFVHGGEPGRVLFVRAQWHATGGSPRDKPWLFRREKSGDIVLEQASHQFDVFNWLFGSTPLRACGLGGANRRPDDPPGRDTMDHYAAVLEYPGGAKVHLSHLSHAIPDRRFSGIYELVFAERMGIDLSNALAWTEGGETRRLTEERGNDTRLAVDAFLRSVQTGTAPEAGAEAGHRATLAAALCRRALESGRTVEWREVDRA